MGRKLRCRIGNYLDKKARYGVSTLTIAFGATFVAMRVDSEGNEDSPAMAFQSLIVTHDSESSGATCTAPPYWNCGH